jgi:hypothetical protein
VGARDKNELGFFFATKCAFIMSYTKVTTEKTSRDKNFTINSHSFRYLVYSCISKSHKAWIQKSINSFVWSLPLRYLILYIVSSYNHTIRNGRGNQLRQVCTAIADNTWEKSKSTKYCSTEYHTVNIGNYSCTTIGDQLCADASVFDVLRYVVYIILALSGRWL